MAKADDEIFHAQTAAQWRQCLDTHHARPPGVWLVSYKQATGKPRVPYDEAVETAQLPATNVRANQWSKKA